jgi:hypothetical protein
MGTEAMDNAPFGVNRGHKKMIATLSSTSLLRWKRLQGGSDWESSYHLGDATPINRCDAQTMKPWLGYRQTGTLEARVRRLNRVFPEDHQLLMEESQALMKREACCQRKHLGPWQCSHLKLSTATLAPPSQRRQHRFQRSGDPPPS